LGKNKENTGLICDVSENDIVDTVEEDESLATTRPISLSVEEVRVTAHHVYMYRNKYYVPTTTVPHHFRHGIILVQLHIFT
jgi:hypothetical protein